MTDWESDATLGRGNRLRGTVLALGLVVILIVASVVFTRSDRGTLAVGGSDATPAIESATVAATVPATTPGEHQLGSPIVSPLRIGDAAVQCIGQHRVELHEGSATAVAPFVAAAFTGDDPPSGCVENLGVALRYGYEPFLPEGAVLVGDVILVPTPDRLRADCAAAADALGIAVACPGLLPASTTSPRCVGRFRNIPAPDCVVASPDETAQELGTPPGGGFAFEFRTILPQTEPNCPQCAVQITTTSVSRTEPGPWTSCSPLGDDEDPPGIEEARRCEPRIDDSIPRWWAPHAGASLVRWTDGDHEFAVSVTLNAEPDLAGDIAVALAAHATLVE